MRFVTTPIGSTTAAEVARITSAGSFGIGTASPSTRLHVLHNQNAGTDITVENTTDGANAYVGLSILGNGGAGGTLRHWAPSSSITRYQDKFVFNSNSSASGVLLEADAGDIEFLHGGLTRFVMKSAGWFVSDEADTDPGTSVLDATDSMAVYMKSNKFVIAYNNAGTITYISIPMDGSTTTWTHNTTAP